MILKNLFRRKARTLLTVLGISIGVASIITLGALTDGLEAGYGSVLSGSQSDLILSQPDAYDILLSSVDEDIGPELAAMPEVEAVSGYLQGMVPNEDTFYFFVFGYPADSFVLTRYNVVQGYPLGSHEAEQMRGKPILLGSAAAEALHKTVGDTVRIQDTAFRVVGIYETGDSFEEGGGVILLEDAQQLLGKDRQVSLFHIKLKQGADYAERLKARVARLFPDYSLSTTAEMGERTDMVQMMRAMSWGIGLLAILIGGIGMMNAQLMAVMERTREIGVLRAVGWRSGRVLRMILGESLLVGILGGAVGVGLAWLLLVLGGDVLSVFGASAAIRPAMLLQSFVLVALLGVIGGLYPAWRASRLEPIEALRYEGGSGGDRNVRLPVGGLAIQNLWRRFGRTALTLAVIGVTVGAIIALDATIRGMTSEMGTIFSGSEVIVRQRDYADTTLSFVEQRVGDRIRAMPGVKYVSGMLFTALINDDGSFLLLLGYSPFEAEIQRVNVVEGERLTGNRQVMVGRGLADADNIKVGETMNVGGGRYRVVGIYEEGNAWLDIGVIVSLRDAQAISGRPNKVTWFALDLEDPKQAREIANTINAQYPENYAALSGEFAENLPDFEDAAGMQDGIALMALLVGGVGVMNTMLMSVLERTREIGVLRALGWRRSRVLGLILREGLALGILGAVAGIGIAFALAAGLKAIPLIGEMFAITFVPEVFARAIAIAIGLGLIGGMYPAFRATRLQPVEALRYE